MSAIKVFSFLLVFGAICTVYVKASCPGCPEEGDANDPENKTVLTKIVTAQNAKSNDEGINVGSIKVEKVTTQVVSGELRTITFSAKGQKTQKAYKCKTVLHIQPWINPEPKVVEYSCTPA